MPGCAALWPQAISQKPTHWSSSCGGAARAVTVRVLVQVVHLDEELRLKVPVFDRGELGVEGVAVLLATEEAQRAVRVLKPSNLLEARPGIESWWGLLAFPRRWSRPLGAPCG